MTKEELLKEISSLVEKYEGQKPKSILVRPERMPKYGEEYWNLSSDGEVDDDLWQCTTVDTERYKQGNVFPTREEALAEAKRRESMAKRHDWRPRVGDEFWCYVLPDKRAIKFVCNRGYYVDDLVHWYIGNVHKTKEEAEEWGREYANVFK